MCSRFGRGSFGRESLVDGLRSVDYRQTGDCPPTTLADCHWNWSGRNQLLATEIDSEIQALETHGAEQHHVAGFRKCDRGNGRAVGHENASEADASTEHSAVSGLERFDAL